MDFRWILAVSMLSAAAVLILAKDKKAEQTAAPVPSKVKQSSENTNREQQKLSSALRSPSRAPSKRSSSTKNVKKEKTSHPLEDEETFALIHRLMNDWRSIADHHYRNVLGLPAEKIDEIHRLNQDFAEMPPLELESVWEEDIREEVFEHFQIHEENYQNAIHRALGDEHLDSIQRERQRFNRWVWRAHPELDGFEVTYY